MNEKVTLWIPHTPSGLPIYWLAARVEEAALLRLRTDPRFNALASRRYTIRAMEFTPEDAQALLKLKPMSATPIYSQVKDAHMNKAA